jgi:hypothetical protein
VQISKFSEQGNADDDYIFDPRIAKAMQNVWRYRAIKFLLLVIAGLAACVAFWAEWRSWMIFSNWLKITEWTSSETLAGIVDGIVETGSIILLPFGVFGITSLFMDKNARAMRIIFLLIVFPLLLLPIFRGESKRTLLIGVAICVYAVFRILAVKARNQTPEDWRLALSEMGRLGWGPEDFVKALTHGRASDGLPLVLFLYSGWASDRQDLAQWKTANDTLNRLNELLQQGAWGQQRQYELWQQHAFGELFSRSGLTYSAHTSLLRIRLQQHLIPLVNSDSGDVHRLLQVTEQECSEMRERMLYVHPEIAERLASLIQR